MAPLAFALRRAPTPATALPGPLLEAVAVAAAVAAVTAAARVEILRPREEALEGWRPAQGRGYGGGHGAG